MGWAWAQRGLDASTKLVLMSLADYANDEGECWPGVQAVANRVGLSDRMIQRHVATLREAGLVRVERRERPDGGQGSNRYFLVHGCHRVGEPYVTPPGDAQITGSVNPTSPGKEIEPSVEPSTEDPQIAPQRPRSNPDVAAFLDFAFQTFQTRFTDPLLIDGGKDGQIVKRLLGTYPRPRLQSLWLAFLDSPDPFIARAGRSIGVFKSQIPKLVAAAAAPLGELRGEALFAQRERERQERGE